MQYLAGGSLEDRQQFGPDRRPQPRPLSELADWLEPVAEALDFVHGQRHIHRDIKPGNILFDAQGHAYISDFGVAKVLSANQSDVVRTVHTRTGFVLGTPQYMAPEMVLGQPFDGRVDQYALAVTVYEQVSGRFPFDGPTGGVILMKQTTEQPPPLTNLVPGVPEELAAAVMRALAKDPRQRFPDCRTLARAILQDVRPPRQRTGVSVARTTPQPEAPPTADARPRSFAAGLLLIGLSLSILFGLLVLGLLWLGGRPVPRSGTGPEQASHSDPLSAAVIAKPATPRQEEKAWQPDSKPAPRPEPAPGPAPVPQPIEAKRIAKSVDLELVRIPAGNFWMGSLPGEANRITPDEFRHEVEIIRDVFMAKYTVTVRQFREFIRDADYRTEAERDGQGGFGYNATIKGIEGPKPHYTWRSPGWMQGDEHPVVNVTWNDAEAFCKWLSAKEGKSFRLPTEAEWEYACRAGTSTAYYSGDAVGSLEGMANLADFSFQRQLPGVPNPLPWNDGYPFTGPVGQFKPNRFGLHDMHGNVWQWCSDWYDPHYYETSPRQDPQGPIAGVDRVNRGGSFGNPPSVCRSAYRGHSTPQHRHCILGFRVVLVY